MLNKEEIVSISHQQCEELDFHKHIIGGWRFKAVLITVLLSIVGYFLFTLWAGWDNVMHAIANVGAVGIVLALALSLMNFLLRFTRWQLFLRALGHRIPWLRSLRIFLSGFALTTTPGKTGEALKGVFLKDYGVPFRESFGAFLAERFSDLTAVTVLAMGGLWIHPGARPILFIVILLISLIIFAVQKDKWLKAAERFANRLLPERFAHTTQFFLETVIAFRNCFKSSVLSGGILLGVLAWTLEAVALFALLQLLGYEINLITAIFIYGFSLVIGGITLLPGGLGGAEMTMLQLLILQEVAAPAAVAITLVIRLTSLWFSVLLGMIMLPKKQLLWH